MSIALFAACAFCAVFVGGALAGNGGGNGNGCQAPGHAYGHDNCDVPSDPPAPPPPPPPSGDPGQSDPPAQDPAPPSDPQGSGDAGPTEPDAPGDGSSDASDGSSDADEESGPSAPSGGDSPSSDPGDAPSASAPPPSAPQDGNVPPSPPDPGPQAPYAGWAPVAARSNTPAPKPAPRPTAPRERTFSSAGPEASWGARQPEASWADSQPSARDYGVSGTGAVISIRRRHGVFGGLSFRVSLAPGSSSLVFRASRSVVAGSGGRLYRIGTWLRSDIPGITVCLRIQEVSPADPLTSVRTSESCLAPTSKWKHFRLFRRTLARGNKLVFSIYSFGAVAGDSFEVDGFNVSRRVKDGWKRVDAAFGEASDLH
jgi:hypothetical protein